ncbi:Shikimate dehydrogenase (NADP(+)) [Dirofilaria immitis]
MSEAITRGDDNEKPSKDVSLTKGKMIDMKGYGTPRRALGDLKNVFATPVSIAIKRRAPEKSQSLFDVYHEKETNKDERDIVSAPETEDFEPVQENDDIIEKFNFEEHIETYEEIFPRPEQRVDIADLLHSVQCDNRFLRSLFSELLDEDGLKLLNEKNPMTNNDCDKALTEIFGGEISRQ